MPTEIDWNLAEIISEKLQLFSSVTELFFGNKYGTANMYFSKVCEIKIALIKWSESPTNAISLMAIRMMKKFDDYWSFIHTLMGVDAVLDPRGKMALL